ncbi:MAG: aspartyl/asparaginyl beta-hydroxylase domain-containing protein [Pseudomonadota bacterium]
MTGDKKPLDGSEEDVPSGTTPKKDLNRSPIVRIGKRIRKKINPYIKRHSRIPDQAVFGREHFPVLEALEENWEVICEEALAVLAYRDAIPALAELSPDHARLDTEGKWRSFFMWGYGFRFDPNCWRCPETFRLLRKIPGLRTALFSIHDPGMRIAPHSGVTAGVCVIHLGLKIPTDWQNCAIRVDDQIVHWREGKAFAFDDTRKHETWNDTDDTRVILLLHVDRPVRFPASILSWVFMQAIRYSPFIGDARRQMMMWHDRMIEIERQSESARKPG